MASPGWAELLRLIAEFDRLRGRLGAFLDDNGPDTGSPLDRYVGRFNHPGAPVWDELRALCVNIDHGLSVRNDLPA